MRHTLPLALVAGFALVLGACGDDGPTEPDDDGPDISQGKAEQVANAVTIGTAQAFTVLFASAQDGTFSFDDTASCPEGGSAGASGEGTGDTSDQAGEFDWNAELSFTDCGVATNILDGQEGGSFFTLSTSSTISFTGNATLSSSSNDTNTVTWNNVGTVDWTEQGGPSETCEVDLTTTLESESLFDPDVVDVSLDGTACDRTIDQTFQITSGF